MAGFFPTPRMLSYAASKAATISLSEGLRREIRATAASNLSVSCVCPSHISTALFKGFKQPFFVPTVTPQYVAEAVLASVRTRQYVIPLPPIQSFFVWAKGVMPHALADWLVRATGVSNAMADFDDTYARSKL